MFKYRILAAVAAASLMAAPAFAQAAPVEVELEGKISNFDGAARALEIMGMEVEVASDAILHTPTSERLDTGLTMTEWFQGAAMDGRTLAGMMGGTGIVLGVWDPLKGKIVANDVFAEPAENVVLGVITANTCNHSRCVGAWDYIRGNSAVGGGPGPAFKPIRDIRMAGSTIRDETGFALNVAGANLTGMAFAAEGYYGDKPVVVQTGIPGAAVSERAFHYFIFDLVEPAPQLYMNKTAREISVLRTDCREGDDDFEIRGFIHTRVNATGVIATNETLTPASGRVEVFYNRANGQLVRANAAPTSLGANSPVGIYRIRFDQPGGECPATIGVRWVQTANAAAPVVYASITGVSTEIRGADPTAD
jgi:hypothetical protein